MVSLLGNVSGIEATYQSLVTNVLLWVVFSFLTYVLLNGLAWDTANMMVNEDSPFLKYELMFGLTAIVLTIVAFLFGGFFIRLLAYIGNSQLAILLGTLMYIVVTYFAYIAFGLINKYKISEFGKFLKHAIKLGYNKLAILLFGYLFTFVISLLFLYFIYQSLNAPMLSLSLAMLLYVLALAWGKIFFLTLVKNSEKHIKQKK